MPTLATSRSQNNLLKRSPPRARKSSNGANQAHHPSKGVNPRVTRSRSSMDLEANEKVDDEDETSGITSLDDDTDGEGAEKMEERKIVSPRRRLTRALSGNMGGVPLFALDSPSPVLAGKNRMGKRALRSPSRKARVRVLSPIVNIPHNRSPFPPRKKRITNLSPYHRSLEASPSSSSAPSGSPREQEYEEESTTDEDLDFEDRPVRAGTKRKRMGTQENGRSLRRRRSSGIGVGMRVLKKGKRKEKLKEEPPSSGASWVSTSTEVDGEQLDEDVDMDEFLLKTSTMSQLHRQRKSSLQRLVSALPSSCSSNALTSTMTKDDLVAAILSARSSLPSTSAVVSISPSASRDVSPSPPPTVKKPNAKQIPPSLDSGDLVVGKKKGRTTSTPFKFEDSDSLIKGTGLSRSKSMGDLKGKSSKFDAIRELGVDGGCTRMTRAQEKKEKKELRNGKFVGVGAKGKAKEAKKRKVTFSELPEESDEPETSEDDAEEWRESGMEDEEEEEEEEEAETDTNEDDEGLAPPTPIARRTRAGSGLVRQESSPNIGGLYITRKKAKKTIDDPSEEEDEEEETGESEGMDVDEEEEVAPKKGRKNSVQPETLPSESEEVEEEEEEEADEGEEGDVTIREDDGIDVDESVEEELTAGRVLRTLRNGKIIVTEDEGEQEEVEEEEEEEGSEEDENMEGVEIDLSIATRASLLRLRRDDLVALCESQELDFEGTKKQLVSRLLKSREAVPDKPAVMDSPLTSVATTTASSSRSSNATATPTTKRPKLKQTKTEILKEIASGNRDVSTPPILLKDKRKRFSSEKPDTPPASGEEAETELNGLDLESLNLLDKEISPDKLTKLEKIGSGGFKDVYKGRYKRYSVAIADIRGHLTEMDIKELSLLRDLRHDNIVRFIGVSIPEDPKDVPCMIVTELCSNGDLYDYIRNVNAPSLEKVLSIMLDIARGLEYLHTNTPSIIHRDLKSSNVLITAKGVGKINDFGLARVKNSTRSMVKSLVGTVNWQAPELWVPHPRYNEKVDVYSAGLVFWEMLQWHFPTKKYPFEGSNEHAIYNDVGKNKMRPSTKGMKPQWGSDILLLIDKMWAQEPSARPRMTEIVHTLEEQYLEARKKKR